MIYPSGKYLVTYEGTAPSYKFDAEAISTSPGRDVIEVSPSEAGIYMETTGSIKNVRVVQEQYESLLNGGEIFHPLFLEKLRSMGKVARFMDWQRTNYGSAQGSWAKRPKITDAFWGTDKGVPLEVMIALCNRMDIDPWFNMPHKATADYVRRFAKTVLAELHPGGRVKVELSNEPVWNGAWPYEAQKNYFIAQGKKLWPTSTDPDWSLGYRAYAIRASQIGDIWKSIMGDRVTVVLSGQAANIGVLQLGLDTLPWKHSIDAIAIAPYFGASRFDGTLDDFFNVKVPADIEVSMGMVRAHKALADQYGLDLVAYEGGPGYDPFGDQTMTEFFTQANRDPRMGAATLDYLRKWKDNGGGLFCYYADVRSSVQYGGYGALESVMQTTSPKYEALKTAASENPDIGINLTAPAYWSTEMPFLDAVKHNDFWIPQSPAGWGAGKIPDLDSNGWINSIPPGESVGMIMYRDLSNV